MVSLKLIMGGHLFEVDCQGEFLSRAQDVQGISWANGLPLDRFLEGGNGTSLVAASGNAIKG